MTGDPTATAAVSTGRRTRLRHVRPTDYERLHQIESDDETAARWRYRGQLPPLQEYETALWKNTSAILVSELLGDQADHQPNPTGIESGHVIGYVHLHDVQERAGHGFFSIYAAPEYRRTGLLLEATYLFGEWLWGNTSLRWIYCHAFEDNLPQFKSAVRHGVLQHFGTYRNRVAIDGVPQDVHLLGISREQWQASASRQRFVRLARSPS